MENKCRSGLKIAESCFDHIAQGKSLGHDRFENNYHKVLVYLYNAVYVVSIMKRTFDDLFEKSGLSLDRLRTLRDFAEYGSFSDIARGDLAKQSQFSRQLSELKGFFGVDLVEKVGRGLQLTPQGKELAKIVNDNFRKLEDFLCHSSEHKAEFKIGAATHNLESIVIPRLGAFSKRHPNVRFQFKNLQSDEISNQLREYGIDFGIVRPNAISHPIKHKAIATIEYCLFAPPKMQLKDALKFPFAINDANEFMTKILGYAEEADIELNTTYMCSAFYQCELLLKQGVAATVLPSTMKDKLKGFAVYQPDWLKKYQRKISLAWRVGLFEGPKTTLAEGIRAALLSD